jgi:hypothetical protein
MVASDPPSFLRRVGCVGFVPVAERLAAQRWSLTQEAVGHLEGAAAVYHRLPLVYRRVLAISP